MRLLHGLVLCVLTTALTGTLPPAAAGQECLYALDQLNNAVTFVRRDTSAIIGDAPMPMDDCPAPPCHPMPTAVKFLASNGRVYVTRQDVKLVYVLDPVAKTVVDTVTIDSGAAANAASAAAALSPDGSKLYVANLAADSVSVISTASNELIDTITVGNQPRAVAFTPDGATALVGNNLDDNLSVVRTSDGEAIDTITVGNAPAGIAVTPNGARAYVTNGNDGSVSVIDLGSRAVIDTIQVDSVQPFGVRGIAITPNGNTAFVTNVLDATVSVIDIASGSVSGTPIPVGSGPVAIALSADGALAYVANLMGNSVSVIDTATRLVDTIENVSAPFDLAFGPCPPAETSCIGDCDGGGSISIGELIIGVNIALGNQPLSACLAFDGDGSGGVSIGELISAVNNSLNGCPS